MLAIEKRIAALESKVDGNPLKLLLIEPGIFGDEQGYRLKTAYKGEEFIQGESETPDEFRDRIEAHVVTRVPHDPNLAVLFLDRLDVAL